jgi:glycolate oxidase
LLAQFNTHIAYFESILHKERVRVDEELLLQCASDHTEDLVFMPDVVLLPISTEEVSAIMQYCNEHKIAVTPRGAGTGLSGGALPVCGGVVIDMRRMNRILDIDTENFQVTTEPGVITEVLQNAVKEKGLCYPVDPASKGSCFIGGNVAENSGGARAAKYGVVKDYVLNLEVVLPNGSVIWTGANTLKNATGYNLTQLIVGSEGTLALITKIVLKLIPHPQHDVLILVPFYSAMDACAAVNRIYTAGFQPSVLEFMEREAIDLAKSFLKDSTIEVSENIQAHLLIEVDGNDAHQLMKDMEGIVAVLDHFSTGEILFADNNTAKQQLWRLRRVIGEAAKSHSVYKEEDTVVPRGKLPQLLAFVKELGVQYGFQSVCYGHAGDGNLHINILKLDMPDERWHKELPQAIRALFQYTTSLGGTLSGEHGIGYVQQQYMDIAFVPAALHVMKQIKAVFDPNHILNPGKLFNANG